MFLIHRSALYCTHLLNFFLCCFIGTEIDGQLMGEFEADAKDLEADSWSFTADKKYLKQLKKDVIKRQDVIYGRVTSEKLRIMLKHVTNSSLTHLRLPSQAFYNKSTAVLRRSDYVLLYVFYR